MGAPFGSFAWQVRETLSQYPFEQSASVPQPPAGMQTWEPVPQVPERHDEAVPAVPG